MTLKQKYWKYISEQLEKTYESGSPNAWSQKVIQSFLLELDDKLIDIFLEDKNKARRVDFRFTDKKEALSGWQSMDTSTFSRIFKYGKTKNTKDRTNDLFAIYLGYDSFEDLINKNGIKADSLPQSKEIKQETLSNNNFNWKWILTAGIAFLTLIFVMSKPFINTGDNANIIIGNDNEIYDDSTIIHQNSEEEKIRRNIHDLALYLTHYCNSLLDSSNPDYFELKVKQIDTIKNELEQYLEYVGAPDEIKIPKDTLESRILLREMVEFEKTKVKQKIRINFGESHFYTYFLSRNMWQYEYFFNIFQNTGDVHTQEALIQLRDNITDLSEKVDFNINRSELSSFLYSPTTVLLDQIILEKKL